MPPGKDLDFEVLNALIEVWGWSLTSPVGLISSYSKDVNDILEALDELWDHVSLTLRTNYHVSTDVATVHLDLGMYGKANFTRIGNRNFGAFRGDCDNPEKEEQIEQYGNFNYRISPAMAITRAFLDASEYVRRMPDSPYWYEDSLERESYFDLSEPD